MSSGPTMKSRTRAAGDAEQREQRAQPVAEQHRLAERDLELIRQPRRVEEERAGRRWSAGCRADSRRETARDRARGSDGGSRRRSFRVRTISTGSDGDRIGLDARRVEDRELRDRGRAAAACATSASVNGVFFRRNVATRSKRTIARCFEASRPALRARLLRQRHEPQAVEHPARDRQHAAVAEMVEVLAERFGGVERVLGQRVGAGGGRRPGIDERRLNHVVARRASPDEAAAVVDVNRRRADPDRCRPSSRETGPA